MPAKKMTAQKPRARLFADMTNSRAEMPFSVASIVDEAGKFRVIVNQAPANK
jgi:hypothetical protein